MSIDFRIEDPQLDFSTKSMFGTGNVAVRITAWHGGVNFDIINNVPVELVGSPQWPSILKGMKMDLISMVLDKQLSVQRYTIRPQ